MSWTRLVTLVVALLGALVFTSAASAITIAGTGKGIELPQGDGIYTLQGTWTDSTTGTHGTYTGTLNNSGDYTTCVLPVNCAAFPSAQHCNIVNGEITFSAQGESFPVFIVVRLFSMFPVSAVCLDPNDPSVHTVFLLLSNPGTLAIGSLSGTSTEAGASGVLLDQFDFGVTLP
jgi:hypothetical protein